MEVIECTINRVVYYNETNGYTVVSVYVDHIVSGTLKGKTLDKLTCVGTFSRIPLEEEQYTFNGELVKNDKYGDQLKITSFEKSAPESINATIGYLSSNLFNGIGMHLATKIAKALGVGAIKKIKDDPTCLDQIKLTQKQKETIIEGIKNDEQNESATLFLLENGVSFNMATKINYKLIRNGINNVVETIKENPYLLIDLIDRFGFKKADLLAQNIGIDKLADIRLKAALKYILKEYLYSTGNSFAYQNELQMAMERFLGTTLPMDKFNELIENGVATHTLYKDPSSRIFDYYLHEAEVGLAKEIALMLLGQRKKGGISKFDPEKIKKCLKEVIEEEDFTFSDEQLLAIEKAFTEPIVIITGGPGTGKTTIVHAILKMYFKLNDNNNLLADYVALIAPTGRAAKRLKETTNMNASTIHRYLGYTGENQFEFGPDNKTLSKLVIIDESSMMDIEIASRLFQALSLDARVIIVGDVDQLPSVGPGQVLKDLIDTGVITTIRLNKIHRQAEGSTIISLAHSINEGFLPNDILEKKEDRAFLRVNKDLISKTVVEGYLKAIEKGKDVSDIEVLVPMYKGPAGINELNSLIQERINPKSGAEVEHFDIKFRISDKVIQLVNRADLGIMNGDIGYIKGFEYDTNKISKVIVEYDIGNVEYSLDELDQITLAYAISIHKAQGSEFDTVFIPFSTSHYVMLKRKLIYTAITRAKAKLIMVGDVGAMHMGISRIEINRNTILREQILEFINQNQKKLDFKTIIKGDNSQDSQDETQDESKDDFDELGATELKL